MKSSNGTPARLLFALVALACGACGLGLAWHHPLSGSVCAVLFVVVAGVVARWPSAGLVGLVALLPWLGLYPWTGWLTLEEFDLALLAVAAGGYANRAWPAAAASQAPAAKPWLTLWMLLYAAALLVSLARGFDDAGGLVWGWWQGYHEPLNSLRLAKSFFLAALLLPLWSARFRADPEAGPRRLSLGLSLGLAAASLAALWERLAFPGLLDFSSDYRTTALFWEMHVGGAAFDGFLALSFPFAFHQLLVQRRPALWALAAGTVLLGAYACLTTFSRGVYLAIPIGLVVLLLLRRLQRRRVDATTASAAWLQAALLLAGFGLIAAWTFPGSGYRGLLAVLGATAMLLPLPAALRLLPRTGWGIGIALGAALSAASWAFDAAFDKGAYAAYALSLAFTAAALWRARSAPLAGTAALGGFVSVLIGVVLIGRHWGGQVGLEHALPVAGVLLAGACAAGGFGRAAWPASWRWQGTLLGGMTGAAMLIAVLGGGSYMTGRFATGEDDSAVRLQHWERGLAELRGWADWTAGKGLGRFAANLYLSGDPQDETGDYRLEATDRGTRLVLSGGKHLLGWGEMLRISQRIAPPVGPLTVSFEARTTAPIKLHAEVCEKHLLYNAGCASQSVVVTPGKEPWQPVTMQLSGEAVSRGLWFAPRLIDFSIAVETSGGRVELGQLRLSGADGRNVLVNSDFSSGLARWFFSSDRYHLPWHMKSLALHVLFEQGGVGLLLFAALSAGALWRVSFGAARNHPLAPALGASLIGFLVVGLWDSLIDVPRVAFVFYLLALVACSLQASRAARVST